MRRVAIVALGLALLSLLAPPPGARGAPEGGDGRVGVVLDLQGAAFVRPVGRDRWSRLTPRSVLRPGDLVRTPSYGAHAVEIALGAGRRLLLGPNALAEIPAPGTARLLRGEAEATGTAKQALVLLGPGDFRREITAPTNLRAEAEITVVLADPPRWLTGYRTSTTDEWMGSLIAQVDGRGVPLTVGYHAVDVVIRDQVAQTTVEQSFVNHTSVALEGVFTFPLPAGASVSGFGMWIDGELVEADVVERQRARRIYEEIRHETRDPGLLEWSGGNLFKASVWPIPGGGEKRIRIRYTQILPREGDTVRYRYRLRSELLRKRPVRQLRIKVSVHSATPLAEITTPGYETRSRRTERDAVVELLVESFRPERDFEAAIELAETAPLAVVTHRRGEDGYFLLRVAPPEPEARGWKRDLTPEGDPLDLVILADTSGSMDHAQRAAQAAFLESLLSLLGEKDRFRILACDLDVVPIVDSKTTNGPRVTMALAALAARPSLGWSNLDVMIGEALAAAGEGAHVVYVGDGIDTTVGDPTRQAQRFAAMRPDDAPTVHAVSTGPAYETAVLEAMASIGGGSVRAIEADPAGCAARFLSEIAAPPLRDVRISFEGVRVARVYPERLPNLPAGREQILVGRFLPTGGEQRGTVVVTGTRGEKTVRYTAPFVVAEDEAGHSFLPRLWARRHLDVLLAQGLSVENREEILALSREFSIMTPLTSLLVLENDEDRERYGLKRRVKMRDGERFFAEAKDAARTEILRHQMRRARAWRAALRRRMLREIANLGEWSAASRGYGYGFVGGDGGGSRPSGGFYNSWSDGNYGATVNFPAESKDGMFDAEEFEEEFDGDRDYRGPAGELDEMSNTPFDGPYIAPNLILKPRPASGPRSAFESFSLSSRVREPGLSGGAGGSPYSWAPQVTTQTLGFPRLGPPPVHHDVPAPDWPDEILAILRKLDRRPVLMAPAGPLEVRVEGESFHPLRGDRTGRWRSRLLMSATEFHLRERSVGPKRPGLPHEEWVRDGTRGILYAGLRLGRRRPSVPEDRRSLLHATEIAGPSFLRHVDWTASIESRDEGRLEIRLTAKAPRTDTWLLTIDSATGDLVRTEHVHEGEANLVNRYEDFVAARGIRWPTRVTHEDGDGRVLRRFERTVREVDADAFTGEMEKALAAHADAIFLPAVDSDLAAARQADHEGHATLADLVRILLEHASYARWDKAFTALGKAEALIEGKPGARWIRLALLANARRGEALLPYATTMADDLAGATGPAAAALRHRLAEHTLRGLAPAERLTILDRLGVESQGAMSRVETKDEPLWATLRWTRQRATILEAMDRREPARKLRRAILDARPRDPEAVREWLGVLIREGEVTPVLAFLESALEAESFWHEHESWDIYYQATSFLGQRQRRSALLKITARWIASDPPREGAYLRHLSALLIAGREKEADAWIAARFEEGADKVGVRTQMARVSAAVRSALGEGWLFHSQYVDERWEKPLLGIARRLCARPDGGGYTVDRILNDWRHRDSVLVRELRAWILETVTPEGAVESMPFARLQALLSRVRWQTGEASDTAWQGVLDGLDRRRSGLEPGIERSQIANRILNLLDARKKAEEAITLQRERLDTAPENQRPSIARDLLDRLARVAWTASIEGEMIALLPRLDRKGASEVERRRTAAWAFRMLVEKTVAGRTRATLGPVTALENRSRAERRRLEIAARREAREGLLERLRKEIRTATEIARPWLRIESLGLAVRLGDDLAAVEAQAGELLLSLPVGESDGLTGSLRRRCSLILAYASLSRRAPEGLGDRVLALYRDRLTTDPGGLDWRYAIFRLLVVLDRTDVLEADLRSWIVPALVESRWRIGLAYVLLERGRLAEATEMFERVADLDELGAYDLGTLADLYLARGEDERRERTLDRRLRRVEEWRLSNRIYEEIRRTERRGDGIPPDLDPEALRTLRVLLTKATHPEQHLDLAVRFYRQTKDHRVLACLADGVVGHSPQSVYAFLARCWAALSNVHEEATCDQMMMRIRERRDAATLDTDRRALWLLEAQVERRAAEVLNQSGPHAEKALAALRAGVPTLWRPGERRQLADYLASMGRVPDEAFAAEQVRLLEWLHRVEVRGSEDRFRIAWALARTRWLYEDHDRAIDELTAAIEEHVQTRDGTIPAATDDAADELVGWLEKRGRFGIGEKYLTGRMASGRLSGERIARHEVRLQVLLVLCLEKGGTSPTLGAGEDLYRGARGRIETTFGSEVGLHAKHLGQSLLAFCRLHVVAHEKTIASASADLAGFALASPSQDAQAWPTSLPGVLGRLPFDRAERAHAVAKSVRDVAGHRTGLELLVLELERQGDWPRRSGRDGWRRYADTMGEWRAKAGPLGDLEPRLLAVVIHELERDLVSLQDSHRTMYDVHQRFWREKADDFAAAAHAVVERHADSPARVFRAASYLHGSLRRHEAAVDVLVAADGRGKLAPDGRFALTGWLLDLGRGEEALSHALRLLAIGPDDMAYRCIAVKSYHAAGRDEDGRKLVEETRERWRERRRWKVDPMRSLAYTCAHYCDYHALAVSLYEELIPLHLRTRRGNRPGEGDSVVARDYALLSQAYLGLGREDEAVDAASSAVVARGRHGSSGPLDGILAKIENLDAWVESMEAKVAETGLDAFVVRRALGFAYLKRKEPEKARPQLRRALALQPDDERVHGALVKACDRLGDAEGACRALLASLPHVEKPWSNIESLAKRYAKMKREPDAERARATLVEMKPAEAEGRVRLARIRGDQKRWEESIALWNQVIALRTFDPAGWLGLADVFRRSGRKEQAIAAYRHVVETPWDDRFGGAVRKAKKKLERLTRSNSR